MGAEPVSQLMRRSVPVCMMRWVSRMIRSDRSLVNDLKEVERG